MIASLRRSLLLLPLLLSGCAHAEPLGPLVAETLAAGSHCGREQASPAAWWLKDEESYRTLSQRLRKPSLPPVDFRTYGVLLVEMGRQNTGGYGLRLAQPEIEEEGGGAIRVRLDWRIPGPGMITTQVITSPCLLLKLPRSDYREIAVVDQRGQTRVTAELDAEPPQPPGGRLPPRLPSAPTGR
jgi:hypothetical protein